MSKTISLVAVVLFVLVVGAAAAADAQAANEAARDAWDSRFVTSLSLGLGTPVGQVGLVQQVNASRYLGAAIGVGQGSDGLQGMLGIRARLPVTTSNALGVSATYSLGSHFESPGGLFGGNDDAPSFERRWEPAHWGNFDLALEARDHFQMRFFIGFALLLNPRGYSCSGAYDLTDAAICKQSTGEYQAHDMYPYTGIEFGWAY